MKPSQRSTNCDEAGSGYHSHEHQIGRNRRLLTAQGVPGTCRSVLKVLNNNFWILLFTSLVAIPLSFAGRPITLSNDKISAQFGDRGLELLTDLTSGARYYFQKDESVVGLNGRRYESGFLRPSSRSLERDRVVYVWSADSVQFQAVYELKDGWRFVSKQIIIVSGPSSSFRVNNATVLQMWLKEPIKEVYVPKSTHPNLELRDYGGCIRFEGMNGLVAIVQNPFLEFRYDENSFSIRYNPEIEWKKEYGPFSLDRGLLAPRRLSGRFLPVKMIPEWSMSPGDSSRGMDEAEVEAFTDCVHAFLLPKPAKPLNVFVGWCVNDYQIDVASASGRTEYKRVMDRAAEIGAEYVLYAPTNSELSRRNESADDWSWEHVLWLGLGQKIRKNEWSPGTGEIPPSIKEMLDYAASKKLKLLAYVYPVVPFSQNPEWLVPSKKDPSRKYASLGVRSFQDWLIETLLAFYRHTGIGGYAFDHTFLAYDGTSRYAQWWGWRRVMEELRRRIPGIAIDGRQAYHLYGPWSWLAGSYPHPTNNDEQPESFVPFPDLHFDRVSANRQRYTAYRYRNYDYAPSEIVPGFITHQTSRSDTSGEMPSTTAGNDILLSSFRVRDWDYLGWKYSLLSSIATGGWNNVLNMIPARDVDEYRSWSRADTEWFRRWLLWTETNKEYLRNTRTILGQPSLGKIDGTSSIKGNRGYIFLFNPNARKVGADLVLDSSMGLEHSGPLMIRELYPREGCLRANSERVFWKKGDHCSITMEGASVLVLELLPAPSTGVEPILFNVPGSVIAADGVLTLRDVRGEVGMTERARVLLPREQSVKTVLVNGQEQRFSRPARVQDTFIDVELRFGGTSFSHLQQIGNFNPDFVGGTFKATCTIPQRIFDQLKRRKTAWPIPWTAEDYSTTWLVPERLLLFVQIAEPDERWTARLRIDGNSIELKKAYSSIRPVTSAFVGFYADVSLLAPDQEHTIELELPQLKPGQFQGLFFENVETEFTERIVR